jgi:hypothetical protein
MISYFIVNFKGRPIVAGQCAESDLNLQSIAEGCHIHIGVPKIGCLLIDREWVEIARDDEHLIADLVLAMKDQRDRFLSACDWTQLADSPLSSTQQSAWRKYRQTLRDLPAQTTDINNIKWPSAPGATLPTT